MDRNEMKIKKDLFRKTRTLKGNSQNRGITLIALVITIIILLILAGVTISALTGSGLFEKTKEAKRKQNEAEVLEKINLAIYQAQIEKEGNAALKDVVKILEDDKENTYVIKTKKTISLIADDSEITTENIENKLPLTAIYISNIKYDVEIEVTEDLKVSVVGSNEQGDNTGDEAGNGSSSGTGNGLGTGTGTGTDEKLSSLITNITFEASNIRLTNMDINITPTVADLNNVIGYHVLYCKKNDTSFKKGKVSESRKITLSNLERGTEYTIYVAAYDVDNNYRISQAQNIPTTSGTVVYNYGVESEIPIVVGPDKDGHTTGSASKKDTYLYAKGVDNTSSCTCFRTFRTAQIDVTDMDHIYVHFKDVNISGNAVTIFASVCKNYQDYGGQMIANDCYAIDKKANTTMENGEFTLDVDVSNLTGNYILFFGGVTVPDYSGTGAAADNTGSFEFKVDSIYL